MSKLEQLIQDYEKAEKQKDEALKLVENEQSRIHKKYRGVFTEEIKVSQVEIKHRITELGKEELKKYNRVYKENYSSLINDCSYTPENYKCGICGKFPRKNISLGFGPRFATCAKHEDFLYLMPNIYKRN